MNVKKNISVAAILLLFFVACTKNLQKLPTTVLGEPAFWKTSSDAILGVSGVYNALQAGGLYGDFMRQSDVFTDNGYSQSAFNHYLEISQNQGFNSASVIPDNVWSACYNGIARANDVLYNVPNISMDTTLRRRLLGETHFLRALFYFHLNNLWSNVPLILTPIPVEDENLPRTSSDSILSQIISDLTVAQQSLPATYNSTDIGRATSTAATALLSRVYLYNGMWAQSAAAANQVMAMPGLGLVSGSNWANQFLPIGKNSATESIFEVQFLGGTGQKIGSGFNVESGALPSLTNNNNYNPGQNLKNDFVTGDIRLPGTILQPGMVFAGVTYTGVNSPTGLAAIKYIIPDATVTNDGSANFIVLRFAEVLLNYAEAQNELLSTPDITVYNAVNKIRNRAGLINLPTGLTQTQMRTAIKQERRAEFAFEGQHFFDLLRWSRAGGNDYQAAMQAVSGAVVSDIRNYDSKLLWWPVPQLEINIDANLLPQNPGW